MRHFAILASAGVLAHHVAAQFVPAPSDLTTTTGHANVTVRYKKVPPGICELDAKVQSFSGYVDIAADQHIFWWFFEARNQDPKSAPLTVWINGGPGSSSMIGLFQELGPCGVDYFGNVFNNPYSWSNVSNMLFIDQPTEVGFSYSKPIHGYEDDITGAIVGLPEDAPCPDYAQDSCGTYSLPSYTLTPNSTENAAPGFWKTLQGFMGAFPQYSGGGLHLVGESYAGHYLPLFAAYIEAQNARNMAGAVPIPLKSLAIGNGWYDPAIGYESYYNFTVSPGNTYDWHPFSESQAAQLHNNLYGPGNCLDQLRSCRETGLDFGAVCYGATEFCSGTVDDFFDKQTHRSLYDIRYLSPDPFPYGFYQDYLNKPDVQKAIGAYVNYTGSSDVVGSNFELTGDMAREEANIKALRALLDAGVSVALYAGDADFICNWIGNEAVANAVGAPGWAEAGYAEMLVNPPNGKESRRVRGHTRQAGNFSFTRIWESGHEVPFYQPAASLALFERSISGLDVATGKKKVGPEYRTVGSPTSTYREGNATFQFAIVGRNYTYDTNTDRPGKPWTRTVEHGRE